MRCFLCQESFRIETSALFREEKGMQELKRLQAIVIASVIGVVLSFGGAVFTAYRAHAEKQSLVLPESLVPVPATAQ